MSAPGGPGPISQSLVAVLLPAGHARAGQLSAVVHLSPRLTGSDRLSAFPDWLTWTDRLRRHGLSFTLSCQGRTHTAAVERDVLRPDLWNAIFADHSGVAPYPTPDYQERLVVSYPSRQVHDFLRYAYRLGASTSSPVVRRRLFSDLMEELVFRSEEGESTLEDTLRQLRISMWGQQHPPPVPGLVAGPVPDTADGLRGIGGGPRQAAAAPGDPLSPPTGLRSTAERFALYHRLPPAPGAAPLPTHPDDVARGIDFHQVLASINAYPELARALGLNLALELPGGFCPTSPSATGYLEVKVSAVHPGWTWVHPPTLAAPSTAYRRDATRFGSAPATAPAALETGDYEQADVVDGFLTLAPQDFQVVDVDLDGAMLKALAMADNLANAGTRVEDDALLPALRSSGLSLLADERGQELLRAIRDNAAFASLLSGASTRPLDARDVTRGYRLDIWSARTGRWHSLHRRDGRYRVDANLELHTSDEEGFTQLAVVQPAEDPTRPTDEAAKAAGIPQPGTDLYLNERVARWNGWSLSAPRPGLPLNRSPDPDRVLDSDPSAGMPPAAFALRTSFTVHPGTLPVLRFGDRYRIRARAVDLAGNSVGLEQVAADNVVLPAGGTLLPYLRWEPVPHPTIVLRLPPAAGGSLLNLVVRSHNSDPTLDAVPVGDVDERHLAPPRAAVLAVEQHGMLDDAQGRLRADAATYQLVIQRDSGQLPTVADEPIEAGEQLHIPYFPDPLARGVALAGLPQAPTGGLGRVQGGRLVYRGDSVRQEQEASVTHVPFGSPWPEREALRLRLVEGAGAPSWDQAQRVLTARLPKGATATVPVSCYLGAEDLSLMGVWEWLRQMFEDLETSALTTAAPGTSAGATLVELTAARARLTRQVLDGGNEFLTPSVPLTLTHAVQQPLGLPTWLPLPVVHEPWPPVDAATATNRFSPITAWRRIGSHQCVLLGGLKISGATTASVDIEARWSDPQDDMSLPGPTSVDSSATVERIPITSLAGGAVAADGAKVRDVAVYLPENDALWFAAPFDRLAGVPTPADVAAPVHNLGDTRHRIVHYCAVASSRFAEYFPEPGAVTSRTGQAITVNVPSSARPVPVDLAYVVPAFGWDRQTATDTETVVRSGNLLRIYLNRPWLDSGSGELLGVLLWPAGSPSPSDAQREVSKSVITQWGLDPIWSAGPLSPVPAVSDFPGAVWTGTDLTLAETAQRVDVAGHQVEYDPDRHLWYCDVGLTTPDSYAPFIRLALARYQPCSIPGAELSLAVLADFAQLTPDRSAAMTIGPADARTAHLVVAGLAPDGPTHAVITAEVQMRRDDVGGDLGWRTAPPSRALVIEDVPSPTQPESVLYSALLRFAEAPEPGRFRVLLREFEVLPLDPPITATPDEPDFGSRLVYAAVLPVNDPRATPHNATAAWVADQQASSRRPAGGESP